jgi:hypothetical protein
MEPIQTEESCNGIIDDRHLFWRILQTAIAALILAAGTGWLVAWYVGAKLDPEAWSVFINAKLPLIWTQTTTTLLTVYFVDLLTPGKTIARILYLEGACDTWQNRAVAAFFLVGLAAVVGYTVKGGF